MPQWLAHLGASQKNIGQTGIGYQMRGAVGSLLVTFSLTCSFTIIKPQQAKLFHFSRISSSSPLLPSHFTPIKFYYSSQTTSITMGASKVSPDHFTGAWYSVPGLRLRDHRFTVPLDYSLAQQSPCITVFAREVVAGNSLRFVSIFILITC